MAATVAVLVLLIFSSTGRADIARNADALRFQVVARTGSAGLISLSPYPSINENGYVAFVATTENADGEAADNVYAAIPGESVPRQLMNSIFLYPNEGVDTSAPGTQTFYPEVQINKDNDVLAWRRLNAQILLGGLTLQVAPLTYAEIWNADGA